MTARNAAEVEATKNEIAGAVPSVKVIGVVADGCKHDDLVMLLGTVSPASIWHRHAWAEQAQVNAELGDIDVLVCNAGTNSKSYHSFSFSGFTD